MLSTAPPRSRPQGSSTTHVAAVLVLCVAFVVLTGLLDGGVGVAPLRLLLQPTYPLANALPGLLLAGLLLTVTRRAGFSFALALLAEGAVYGINALKMLNLGTPLQPADFHIVGQLRRGGMHLLSGYLPQGPWAYVALITIVAALIALWRIEPPLFSCRRPRARVLTGAVLAVSLGSLLAGSMIWAHAYNGRRLWMEPWSTAATTEHAGLISALIMFRLQAAQPKAKPDRLAAQQLIDRYVPQLRSVMQGSIPATSLPDIVVVQSESFFDPTIMRGLEHSQFTPNLHRLAAQGVSGALHVPTFGGGTIRTEFEVLTGLSLRYFDELQFPYLQMGHKAVPSLLRTLGARGYQTTALHGNDPAFWNRTTAFKALGFDRFVSQADFPIDAANDGKYMADSAMTDAIMAQLPVAGPPQFLFAISIEAHGPYDVPPADLAKRDAIAVPAGIEGKDKLELQNYLYHLRHADQELGRLAAWVAQRQRPTVLLFYGDHLPALTNSYAVTGFVDGGNMLSQAGVWLLIDPRHPAAPTRVDTAAWLLPAQLLAHLGIHDDPYYDLTELIGSTLTTLTRAPGAPQSPADAATRQLDKAAGSVAQLRLRGKLEPLLAEALSSSPTTQLAHATPAHQATRRKFGAVN